MQQETPCCCHGTVTIQTRRASLARMHRKPRCALRIRDPSRASLAARGRDTQTLH
jgi:hypothetical protein